MKLLPDLRQTGTIKYKTINKHDRLSGFVKEISRFTYAHGLRSRTQRYVYGIPLHSPTEIADQNKLMQFNTISLFCRL